MSRDPTLKRYIPYAVGLGLLLVGGLVAFAILYKPYDVPEYAEIDTSESAFLIPMEGESLDQSAFPSVQFLQEKKVAAKRVQIVHRWNKTGFLPAQGHWISTVRLVKVDRRPVTRIWTKAPSSGTSAKDEAIAAESKDSVNFTMGVSCTANIPEEMAAAFLYTYPSKSLSEMMDMEVRARVQQVIAEESAKYDLEQMKAKKNDIMKAVREDVTTFFKERGIQITTVAMLGGLTFENPEIQKAIDDAVKATQLKVAAENKREAQEVENKTLKLAAEGKAAAARLEAAGHAESEAVRAEAQAKLKLKVAEAEAEGLRKLAAARAEEARLAQDAPSAYVQLRALEAELQRWKQWDGKYPAYWLNLGGSSVPNVMLPLPALPAPDATKSAARAEEKK
jgi:regulator of protease activity HflC (stomatin/prohibitin superfamily)